MLRSKLKRRSSRIRIRNQHASYKLNEFFIKKLSADILKRIRAPQTTELEIIFMDNPAIKLINRRYKKLDAATDVLSFKLDRREFGSNIFLGEIFISLDMAFRNSKAYGTQFTDEIMLYIIHAILHLFGYDDSNLKDKDRMSKKQSVLLDYLCKKENLSKVLMPR